jgi:membrane-bound serine protease (ClpP class)
MVPARLLARKGLLAALCVVLHSAGLAAAEPNRLVYVAPIEGIIDLGLAPYVARVVQEAEAANAAVVVLDINTLGGRVDAAVQIRDTLLRSKIPSVAFINKRAISAGALISLAAERIAMSSGSTIGAATPVQMGQPGKGAQPVEEKTVSYVRKEFRATAESRNRPALIAEAMVDADVEIKGLIQKGKLLTLTTKEAMTYKVADFEANSLDELLKTLNLADAEIRRVTPNWAEEVVRFLTHPVVSSLLITIAMVGILVEIRTPGFGVPGALGVSSLGLFLWGHWIVQLAGLEELLIAAAGLTLLAIELLFLPGFGIAGILGIIAILAGLVLSMIGPGDTPQLMMMTATRAVISVAAALIATLVLMRFLPKLPFGRRLVLETKLSADKGFESSPDSDRRWLGKTGHAATPLHPAGIAEIEQQRVDVVSDGELIDAGELITVVRVDGNRIVVRRHTD